jgi:hypothetical protein
MHRPATEGMRMKHERDSQTRSARLLDNSLKFAVGYGNEKITGWVHCAKPITKSGAVTAAGTLPEQATLAERR